MSDKNKNIYNYKPPKSMNEEVHYFLTKGRITIGAFWLRWLLAVLLNIIVQIIYHYYALPKYFDKLVANDLGELVIRDSKFLTTFNSFKYFALIIFPILLFIFIMIQAVKRIHDTNKTGWYVLVPLYNLILMFTKGTDGNNDYGVSPYKRKKVKYFDELEKGKK